MVAAARLAVDPAEVARDMADTEDAEDAFEGVLARFTEVSRAGKAGRWRTEIRTIRPDLLLRFGPDQISHAGDVVPLLYRWPAISYVRQHSYATHAAHVPSPPTQRISTLSLITALVRLPRSKNLRVIRPLPANAARSMSTTPNAVLCVSAFGPLRSLGLLPSSLPARCAACRVWCRPSLSFAAVCEATAALVGSCSITRCRPDSENGPAPTTGAVPRRRGVADPGVEIGMGLPRGTLMIWLIS